MDRVFNNASSEFHTFAQASLYENAIVSSYMWNCICAPRREPCLVVGHFLAWKEIAIKH